MALRLTPGRVGAMAFKLHVAGISVLKVTPKVGFVGDTALVEAEIVHEVRALLGSAWINQYSCLGPRWC